ncbi:hypothetical protein EDD21DRAFT_370092 [Dissophora ornata]|nr:hypothetical protein EDD21DRAFT_370092 [Dissophora ornata]
MAIWLFSSRAAFLNWLLAILAFLLFSASRAFFPAATRARSWSSSEIGRPSPNVHHTYLHAPVVESMISAILFHGNSLPTVAGTTAEVDGEAGDRWSRTS